MFKKIFKFFTMTFIITIIGMITCIHSFAMPTNEFDNKMKKGIEYYNKQMYYEARDEFQWFCDYNWGRMNEGQQQYVLDYLGGTKLAIFNMEYNYVPKRKEFKEYKEIVLKNGYYDKQNNWYFYEYPFADNATTFFAYDFNENRILITFIINEDEGKYSMTVSVTEDENKTNCLLVKYYYNDGYSPEINYNFTPYQANWTLITNDFGIDESYSTMKNLDRIDFHLQYVTGLSLSDIGVIYY